LQAPIFPFTKAIIRHYLRNLRYPHPAVGREGSVYFSVAVSANGTLDDFKIYTNAAEKAEHSFTELVTVANPQAGSEKVNVSRDKERFEKEIERVTKKYKEDGQSLQKETLYFKAIFRIEPYDTLNLKLVPNEPVLQLSDPTKKQEVLDITLQDTASRIFTKTEINAQYPGGAKALSNFITREIEYPTLAIDEKKEGPVKIQFIVNKEGSLSDFQRISGEEILARSVINALQKSQRWSPAIQNGRTVTAYSQLLVTFTLKDRKIFLTQPKVELVKFQPPVLEKVDIEASYPGGIENWKNFLAKNVQYPLEARDKKIEGTVIVKFLVSYSGEVSTVTRLSGPESLSPEAIRIIKASGKWEPAKVRNVAVSSYRKQPIVFKL
ncbi:MAG: energy transducer TonB, partial [Chitinophagaceae bacterium]|nr:energy transducer TonB [Chitinophagaceae bacterium]